ncbi:TetR/AcrR family transcriptional regulator [Actinoplanes sp. NPDC051633]|jgi:AcrR family transcriptional regulator|uniref:TetR/AcrR family transcriptional regulator n=1 Tax=Actinoplanes sp. NPDC051633 TaxID=3155670 RepID=UPI0034488AC9
MSSRDRILDAAAHVMGTIGLARSTTREIARQAGYSEAMLYKSFRTKEEIFLAVLKERAPGLNPLLADLPKRVGHGDVADTVDELALVAVRFYRRSFPIAASLFAEPQLLAAHRDFLRDAGAGPQMVSERVAAYLAAEQGAGRVRPDADPAAIAHLLLGGCLNYAFLSNFTDDLPWPSDEECAQALSSSIRELL